jgi:hypothetical protein
MSTKTNFKRIALVAVAALGLGVLSSVPSQAVGNLAVTITNGSFSTGQSDSLTAATISVTATIENALDTITVAVVPNGTLGDSVSVARATDVRAAEIIYLDTTTAARTLVGTLSSANAASNTAPSNVTTSKLDSQTVQGGGVYAITAATAGNVGAKFGIQTDSSSTTAIAGTYSFTVIVKQYSFGITAPVTNSYTANLVVAALATASTVANSGTSTAVMTQGATYQATGTVDSTVAVPNTASATVRAIIRVSLKNAAGGNAQESITVTTDKGTVQSGSVGGKSLTLLYSSGDVTAGYKEIQVLSDGTSGTATINISTPNVTFAAKTVTFYGTAYKSIVASSYRSVIGTGAEPSPTTTGAIKANAYDANAFSYGSATAVYAYSSDTSVVSDYGTACTWVAADSVSYCSLTGVKAGTASITLRDAATVAASTVTSNAVSVRVSQGVATSFTLTTDKASYAPGEKGYLIVTVRDAAGLVMPTQTFTNLFDKNGLASTAGFGNGTDTAFTTATPSVAVARSSTPSSTDPIKAYVFYAPTSAGSFTISAKGGVSVGAASQANTTTVTATVADSASAALAAVSALAVTVASLKTLITTLTNLVLKIQKKVKA